jgi:integrase
VRGVQGHKLKEAAELREALAAGADLRDRRGRRLQPLSVASLRKLIDTLAAILDDAIEDQLIDRNPARGKRMRIRVPKPTRSFLEMDELVALLTAAEALDHTPAVPTALHSADGTRDRVARLAAVGRPPSAIASELGIARATVSYHLANLGAANGRAYLGSGAIVEMLSRAGLRVSELCDLRLRDVRLQPRAAAHCRIVDAKTAAGIREVQLTPDLADRLTRHVGRLHAAGRPIGPDAYLFPNVRGGRITRQRVGRLLAEASRAASEELEGRGLPPLPTTTPHTLRRTYISIALLANGFDVKWVMSQVGHADLKMTLDSTPSSSSAPTGPTGPRSTP